MAATRLLYVMDPMCSWCWGFAPVVEALTEQAARVGVALELRLGGLRRATGMALDSQLRQTILEHWQAVAETTGQAFRFEGAMPPGFVYDTEPACRALVAARALDATALPALLKGIQQAFYAEGRDVTRSAELRALAEAAGLPRQAFAEAFDAAQAATAADFAWVDGLGISGFPTLLAEHKGQFALLTNGYQPLAQLQPLLGRWLERVTHA